MNISAGILDAVPNPGLGTEMHDAIEIVARRHLIQRVRVREIDALEPEAVVELA